jgi:hypothetical protein
MTKSKGLIKKFTAEEDNFLRENYLTLTGPKLALKLGRAEGSVYGRIKLLGLILPDLIKQERQKITTENLRTEGVFSRFPKGHIPANKGKKMSPDLYEKVKATMLKKGNIPPNTKYNGCLSIRGDSKKGEYVFIRLSKCKWELLHRVVWEKHYGLIPKGFNVIFKDKDRFNFKINNLQLVSNRELMKLNSFLKFPEDVRDLIRAKSVLTRQINKILNNE